MMNEEFLQSSSPSESDLPISDDSQAKTNGKPESSVEERTVVDPTSSDLASNDLIPHPETDVVGLSSHLPEPTSTDSIAPSPLTPEIFASGTLPAGTQLGHYVIKTFIGGGGMGRVYLATDTALDRKVAVKVLPRQRANDQGTVARFMNEAKSAARLNHEHIAQVYFAGEQAGIPYIVFEYVEGTNIRTMVNDFDAFPLPQALNYLIQISHALAHAAEHGVVHRDVKPSNILITREGRAKLIDMGLARLLDPSDSQDDLTASGVTLGTFDYISPEQARDPRNADIRSDIYSLGCTFFYMLSGRPPFPEGTVLQKLLQHQGDEPPDIRSFQPSIPAEVALLIQKMMAKEPRQRFQTPSALVDALVNAAKMLGLQPTGPGKLVWVMTPPSRTSVFLKHIPWFLAVVFLFVAFFLMNLYTERQGTLPLLDLPDHVIDIAVDRPGGGSESTPTAPTPQVNSVTTTESRIRPAFRVESYASWRFEAPTLRGVFSVPADSSLSGSVRAASRLSGERTGRALGPSDMDSAGIGPWDGKTKSGAALSVLDVFSRTGPVLPVPESIKEPRSLCVDPAGTVSGSYPTLAAALLDAGKNATIELRWDHIQTVDSLTLSDCHIRFVAAEGFYPVLQFRPPAPKSLFRVTDCELEFRNLALDMRISPTILAENWSMFSLAGTNRITVERSSMTIRNKSLSDNSANHDDVAFFRNGVGTGTVDMFTLEPSPSTVGGTFDSSIEGGEVPTFEPIVPTSPSTDPAAGTSVSTETDHLDIVFTDSILRGEASVFRCDVPQAVEIKARNSFFALAMPFVRTEDTRRTTRQETAVRIDLDRTTFFGRQSFAYQIQRSHDTHPIRLEVNAARSIFFLNNAPLSVFRGAPSPQGAYDYFQWTGEADYFQNVSLGWRFRADTTRSSGGVDYSMNLDDWKNTMNRDNEKDSHRATKIDVLRFEEIRKPTHLLLPRDLTPQFLSEAEIGENEKKTTGADSETFDWMRRSWTGEE